MTPVTGPQGWDRTDALLVRQRARRFRRRLFCGSGSFTWTPETTARFSRLDDRSRNQAPPCQVAVPHPTGGDGSTLPAHVELHEQRGGEGRRLIGLDGHEPGRAVEGDGLYQL